MTDPKQEAPRVVWCRITPDEDLAMAARTRLGLFDPMRIDRAGMLLLGAYDSDRQSDASVRYIRADLAAELARECLDHQDDAYPTRQSHAAWEALRRRISELEGPER